MTTSILKNTWKVISSLATLTFKTTRKIALSSTALATLIFQTPWKIISSLSTLATQIFETVFRHSLHWLRLYSRLGENAHHWLSWLPSSTSSNYLAMYFLQDIQCSLIYFTCLQLEWLNIYKCSIFYYLGYFGKSYFSRFQQNEKSLDAKVKRIQRSQWHQKFFLIDIMP